MSSLTTQILNCFSGDQTVDRATFSLETNYDSIGRVLKQLVNDRMLVRLDREPRLQRAKSCG
jgi:hypothetical protein